MAIALHARTAEQHYAGDARWAAIAELKAHVTRDPGPRQRRHLGGGRRGGDDAPRPAATASSSDAVASAGRGCSATSSKRCRDGRCLAPAVSARSWRSWPTTPRLLAEHMGEMLAVRDIRKHLSWYVTGYPVGPEIRRRLGQVRVARPSSTTSSPRWTRPSSWCRVADASSVVTRTVRSGWRCPTAISTTSTTPPFPTTGVSSPCPGADDAPRARLRFAAPARAARPGSRPNSRSCSRRRRNAARRGAADRLRRTAGADESHGGSAPRGRGRRRRRYHDRARRDGVRQAARRRRCDGHAHATCRARPPRAHGARRAVRESGSARPSRPMSRPPRSRWFLTMRR